MVSKQIFKFKFFLMCRLQRAPGKPPPLPGRPSTRGCSAGGSVLCLLRRCSLRLFLFCTCPSLCAGTLWPMPAWIWRDTRFFKLYFFKCRNSTLEANETQARTT